MSISSFAFMSPLENLEKSGAILTLDFSKISISTPDAANIQKYFENVENTKQNPRTAPMRQAFNNHLIDASGLRYLVSQYGEDRSSMLLDSDIMSEGRVLHLGIDIFSKNLEKVYSPCDGVIVLAGNEPEDHSFGHFLLIKPDIDTKESIYIFLGHLSHKLPAPGTRLKKGGYITTIGDYLHHENGGWSRHLHLQMFTRVPQANENLVGYSSSQNFFENAKLYPNPTNYFQFFKDIPPVESILA